MGRARLKNLQMTTLKTFFEVATLCGLEPNVHFRLNQQKGIISFANGSEIFLKDLYFYPSDPNFTALGSLEISDAFIDEAGEVEEKAFLMVSSRIRFKLDLTGGAKVLLASNPSNNWLYTRFYLPSKLGKLPPHRFFIQSLFSDNLKQGFAESYLKQLQNLFPADRERLLMGNWEYASEEDTLFHRYQLDAALENGELVPEGPPCISADIARLGRDHTVIGVWLGWKLVKIEVLSKSRLNEVAQTLNELAIAYKVPTHRIIIDADGVGGGVADIRRGVIEFQAQQKPPKVQGKAAPFPNLKTYCFYQLAEHFQKGTISLQRETLQQFLLGKTLYDAIVEELQAHRRVLTNKEGTFGISNKRHVRNLIGRSPDLADMLAMRCALDLLPDGALNFR